MIENMPVRYVRSLLKLLPEGQQAELLDSADIDLAALRDSATVSMAQYAQVFSLVLNQLQTTLHGSEAGSIQQFSCYRLLLEAMCQSENLAQALDRMTICFRRLSPGGSDMSLLRDDVRVALQFQLPATVAGDWSAQDLSRDRITLLPGAIGHATFLWVWHRLIGWLIGGYIALDAVKLNDPAPSQPMKYSKLFDAPVYFNKDKLELNFSRHYLDYPVVQTAASVDQLMDNFLLQLFQVDTKGSSTTARVRALIGYDFSHPMPSIDQIAERLNMAVPTLHRRLQKEDSGYQKIKDDCRRQVAVDLLLNSTLP
ncbi:MAG: AraC family transcriptional regulator ligand-binding domain-containing protein, partial [Pseudomonadales bacterium]